MKAKPRIVARQFMRGASVLALIWTSAGGAAWADCQPDPPSSGDTVTCSGTDTGGFQHPEIGNLTVNVQPEATVTTGTSSNVAAILAGSDSTVSNQGTVATNGDQTASAGLWRGGTAESAGTITIGGTNSSGLYAGLDVFLNGTDSSLFSATVRNSGQITASGAGSAGLLSYVGGTIENSGLVQVLADGTAGLASRGPASATNSGSILSNGTNSSGLFSALNGGNLTNSGTITVQGKLSAGMFNLGGSTVLNTGTITTTGDDDLGMDNQSAGASITNQGTITSSGLRAAGMYGEGGSQLFNDSNPENVGTTARIESTGAGSSGVTLLTSSSLMNSGTITASGTSGIGAYGSNFNPFTMDAPSGPTYESVTNGADGQITGTTAGVGFAQIAAAAPPSLKSSSKALLLPTANKVDNAGSILQNGGTGGAGILAITEALVPNSTQVQISDGGGTEIVNSGDITAIGTGISFTPVADYPQLLQQFGFQAAPGTLVPTQDNIVTNTGTITGGYTPVLTAKTAQTQSPVAIQGGAGREFVTNKGAISGDVRLGGGNDTLTLFTESSNDGNLDGGDGTDALVLDGTGTGIGTGGAAGFFGNAITNFETLTKQGTGNWSLSAPTPPTFTGVTVSQGTLGIGGFNSTDVTIAPGAQLVFDGPVHTTGTVTVNGTLASEGGDPIHIDGGTLKGASTIEAPVVLGGDAIVAPGNSPGTLTINGDFTMGPNNHLQIEIADLTHFDLLKVLGVATLDGKLDVLVDSAFAPPGGIATGQTFDVVSANSIVDGLDVLTDNLPGFTFTKQVLDLGGGDQVLRLTVNAVPLPGTLPLIGSALAVFGLLKRKKAA